ncbi:MAG: D-Ala-D-Ala carboxypeptidase family metallohydrolase [Pseudomonadales bacterium]
MRITLCTLLLAWATCATAWDDSRLSVPLVVDERTVPYPEFAIYVMPDQTFEVGFRDASGGGTVAFRGSTQPAGGARLQAPSDPGLERLVAHNVASGERAVINVFTMVPANRVDAKGVLNGYRIGAYPREPLRGQDIYLAPTGFVEVTAANAATRVSPNFRLEQFLSKQDLGEPYTTPRYLVLRANLLLKLENILATLNRSGRATDGLVVMSGFRTPFYNKAIGNVPYSRHVWGGAADIYIDEAPADGRMDDLNGDGKVDRNDARWFADFVNEMSRSGDFGPRIGGLGVYGSNAAHGPFIHVDVRGSRARW